MNEWEFLIQQEGDRSWLPLDSPDVEILEGRYRIVARSTHPNLDVEVRISHLATDEIPPKRRMQKRLGKTNAHGLMVIIPYTQLQPGLWDLRCDSPDTMAHLLGQPWSHTVRLQVLAHTEADAWDDSDPMPDPDRVDSDRLVSPETGALSIALSPENVSSDHDSPASAIEPVAAEADQPATDESFDLPPFTPVGELPTHPISVPSSEPSLLPETQDLAALNLEMAQVLGMSMEQLIDLTEELSHQVIEEAFRGVSLGVSLPVPTPPAVLPSTPIAHPIAQDCHAELGPEAELIDVALPQITLNQTSWVAEQGATIVVNGLVEVAKTASTDQPALFPAWLNTDVPSSQQPDDEAILQVLRSPTAFDWQLELVLRDPQTATVLVQQQQDVTSQTLPVRFQFSIPLPHHLNTRLAMGEVRLQALSTSSETGITLASQSLTVTLDPERLMAELTQLNTLLTHATDDHVLPDSLRQDFLRAQRQQSLDLSFLSLTTSPASPPMPTDTTHTRWSQTILPPQLHEPTHSLSGPKGVRKGLDLPSFGTTPRSEELVEPIAEMSSSPFDPVPTEAVLTTSWVNESDVFQSTEALVGQLIAETETAAQQPESAKAVKEAESEVLEEKLSPVEEAFQALNLEERFFQRLVALAGYAQTDAEEMTSPLLVASMAGDRESYEFVVDDEPYMSAKSSSSAAPASSQPRDLLPEQPIPMPTLKVTTPELVAGKPMALGVSLPDVQSRLYVKLWMSDRQTRTVLDGPHWLMDFSPNGHGAMTAKTQFTVPLGTVEIQVEAITVEPETQRESRKVSLDRPVLPAEQPDLVLDELDLYSIIR